MALGHAGGDGLDRVILGRLSVTEAFASLASLLLVAVCGLSL